MHSYGHVITNRPKKQIIFLSGCFFVEIPKFLPNKTDAFHLQRHLFFTGTRMAAERNTLPLYLSYYNV